jgi:hypothetical protein
LNATEILNALIANADDAIWATELALLSGGRRVDFWTLQPIASKNFRASAYEIKVSRGDYKRDCIEKQEAALTYCDRFWYVTPPKLLAKAELPDWAGLQEWDGEGFKVIRKAPMRRKAAPSWELVVSILRNAGDCRRDVGLLKAQIAFYEHSHAMQKQREKQRNSMFVSRMLNRAKRVDHSLQRTSE